MESDKENSIHEHLHLGRITCVGSTHDGEMIVTGGTDRTIRLWNIIRVSNTRRLEHQVLHFAIPFLISRLLYVVTMAPFSVLILILNFPP